MNQTTSKPKDLNKIILFVLVSSSIFLSNCTTAGYFTSNPKGRLSYAGTEFILTKSDSFQLKSWTDVIYVEYSGDVRVYNKRKYLGKGVYRKKGDSLYLRFTSTDSIRLEINKTEELQRSKYSIAFFDELGTSMHSQFLVYTKEDKVLHQRQWMGAQRDNFTLSESNDPIYLKITGYSATNAVNPIVRIDSLPYGNHIFHFKTYDGYHAKNEEVVIWFKTRPTGIRYELNGRKRYLPRKWRWKFLNRFYRDY